MQAGLIRSSRISGIRVGNDGTMRTGRGGMSGLGQDTVNLAGGARMGSWGWGNSKPDGLIHWSVIDAVGEIWGTKNRGLMAARPRSSPSQTDG